MPLFKSKHKPVPEPAPAPAAGAGAMVPPPPPSLGGSSSSSSNLSNADTRIGQGAGSLYNGGGGSVGTSTIVKTTTTTTTVVTQCPNGEMRIETFPADNSVPDLAPAQQPAPIEAAPAIGSRPIPPRSELRNVHPQHPTAFKHPDDSNDRDSDEERHPPAPPSAVNNFSRPGPGAAPPHHHHRPGEHVLAAAKGLHGAGEALRGTLNGAVARGMGQPDEAERYRAVREQGLREVEGAGFRTDAAGALLVHHGGGHYHSRKRSGSGRAGGGGLERVEERVVNI